MKKNQRKKKMTLENLADMIQKGFIDVEDRLGKRIDGVEQRLDGVEQRLDGVEQRLDGVEQRLDGVEQRLDGVEVRLGGVERRLDEVVFDVSDLKKGQEEIIRKLDDKVERKEFIKLERRVRFLEKFLVRERKS